MELWHVLVFAGIISTVRCIDRSSITLRLYNSIYKPTPLTLTSTTSSISTNTKNTKVIIHGWLENENISWYGQMVEGYLKKGDFNVITVDWSQTANLNYLDAIQNIEEIGLIIAKVLLFDLQIKPDLIHIVAHCIGSHIAGHVGKSVQVLKPGQTLQRISGCDPAGPMFETMKEAKRLCKTDAACVDVIHTDGYKYGIGKSIGSVDFFPNGGLAIQPGCVQINFSVNLLANVINTANGIIGFCSNTRAAELFAESITSNKFLATPCSSWFRYVFGFCLANAKVVMGEDIDTSITGDYYLWTNGNPPYAQS